ncbi:MAG: hypothetical protein WC091_06250 [Sulfuricellaceae bacterium]
MVSPFSPFSLISLRLCVSAVNSLFLSGEQIYPDAGDTAKYTQRVEVVRRMVYIP